MSTDNVSDKIAQRAYELYVARGGKNGTDMDDWLRAEREIKSKSAKSTSMSAAQAAAPKVVSATTTSANPKKPAPPVTPPKRR